MYITHRGIINPKSRCFQGVMELSDIESFDFFFDSIWKKEGTRGVGDETTSKEVGNIVDTIIFQQGRPHKWLFTSVKTGVLLISLLMLPT